MLEEKKKHSFCSSCQAVPFTRNLLNRRGFINIYYLNNSPSSQGDASAYMTPRCEIQLEASRLKPILTPTQILYKIEYWDLFSMSKPRVHSFGTILTIPISV